MKKLFGLLKLFITLAIIGLFVWFLVVSPMLTFRSYEETFKEAAIRYFQLNKNELPTGERVKTLSLNALYKKSYLEKDFFVPYSEKMCSIEKSWVKVKKDQNGEYQYYVYLDCGTMKSNIDHEGPTIKLKGDDVVTIDVGDEFKDDGVKSVKDDKDGKLSVDIVTIKSNVDTSKIGTYEVKYIALDSLNNKTTVTRTVEVVKSLKSVVKKDLGEETNYKGNPLNNYIRISNMYFRIFGLTEDGNVIVVSDEDIANVSHDKIEKWLDEYFYDYLNDFTKDNIVESKFCNMNVDDGIINTTECTQFTKKRKLYIPSIIEVNKAQGDVNNYMKTSTLSWVSNKKDDKESYLTRSFFSRDNAGKSFITYDNNMNFGVRPMFVLDGDVLIKNGDGTVKKPYEFGDSKKIKYGNKLSERETGEYVYISGVLYRIIEITKEGTTRVISMDSLGINNYDIVTCYPDPNAKNIIYNPKDKNSVGYYINNDATEYIDTTNFVNHEIKVPIYGDKIIYGKEKKVKKYTVKLAAPNMFEMFSARGNQYGENARLNSYWMINSSDTFRIAGAVTDAGVPLNEKIQSYWRFGIRVVAQINKAKVVVSGKGTYFEPYIIN